MTSGPSTVNYPFNWPNTNPGTFTPIFAPLKGRITSGITAYENPYNISNYSGADCHIPKYMHDYVGIFISNIGQNTYPAYKSVVVGASSFEVSTTPDNYNSRINLFDNLAYGVSATNGNVILHNNAFTHPHIYSFKTSTTTLLVGGYGVFTQMNDATLYQALIEPVYEYETGGTATAINSFYSCKYGFYCKDYYHLKGDNSYIVTRQNYSSTSYDPNTFGYFVKTKAYDKAEFNHNQITNTPNGIAFTSTFQPGYYSSPKKLFVWPYQWSGSLQVDYNTISAAFDPTITALTTKSTAFAIAVQNAAGLSFVVNHVTGNVETNGNNIDRAWRGILVNGFNMQQVFTENNKITIRSHAGGAEACYGISHTYNRSSVVWNNNVAGSNPGADLNNTALSAFYESHCSNPSVGCNSESAVNAGYEFYLQNPNTAWHDNGMTNNIYGFVLNQSIINQQGGPGIPINNVWNGASGWPAIGHHQTYVAGTSITAYSAQYSPIYVTNSSSTLPTNNFADVFSNKYTYSAGSPTSPIQLAGSPKIENICLKMNPSTGGTDAVLHNPVLSYNQIAMNAAPFPSADSAIRSWTGQYLAWQNAIGDSILQMNSVVIDSFLSMAQNSRYAYVNNVENTLLNNDSYTYNYLVSNIPAGLVNSGKYFDSTTGAYVVDDSSDDYIVKNCLNFYGVYQNYLTGSLTCLDSNSIAYMANLCPPLYGPVVYQSRALYTAVFDALHVWTDSCSDLPEGNQCHCGQNGKGARSGGSSYVASELIQQQYWLSPNPNNGNFTIHQLLSDSNPVIVEIWNEVGKRLNQESISFQNNEGFISFKNVTPGFYFLTLVDSEGHSYHIKFIVE